LRPLVAAVLTEIYPYAACSRNIEAQRPRLGGDPGDGLDFFGHFVYAVDVGGVGGVSIGDATFTSDRVANRTFEVMAQHVIARWGAQPLGLGSSAADLALAGVLSSLRWSEGDNPCARVRCTPPTEGSCQLGGGSCAAGVCAPVRNASRGTVCDDGNPDTMGDLCGVYDHEGPLAVPPVGAGGDVPPRPGQLRCAGLVTLGATLTYAVADAVVPPPRAQQSGATLEARCVGGDATASAASPAQCSGGGGVYTAPDARLVMEHALRGSLRDVLAAANLTVDASAIRVLAVENSSAAVVVTFTVKAQPSLVTAPVRAAARVALQKPSRVGLGDGVIAAAFAPTPQCTCACCMGAFCAHSTIPNPVPSSSCGTCYVACARAYPLCGACNVGPNCHGYPKPLACPGHCDTTCVGVDPADTDFVAVTPLTLYAWERTAADCAAQDCSDGVPRMVPDAYTCLSDGVRQAGQGESVCSQWLGPRPTTRSECCAGLVTAHVAAGTPSVTLTLGALRIGTEYRVQLLFADRCATCARALTLSLDGVPLLSSNEPFLPRQVALGSSTQSGVPERAGAALIFTFVATRTETVLVLGGAQSSSTVADPILSGFTVEENAGQDWRPEWGLPRPPQPNTEGPSASALYPRPIPPAEAHEYARARHAYVHALRSVTTPRAYVVGWGTVAAAAAACPTPPPPPPVADGSRCASTIRPSDVAPPLGQNWVCSAHGHCHANGTCSCTRGYVGATCGSCDVGYIRWRGEVCVRDRCWAPPGAEEVCRGHGVCRLQLDGTGVGAVPVDFSCTCAPGFAGRSCERCAEGFIQYPLCRDDPCTPDPCAGRGVCNRVDGSCRCNTGYLGRGCVEHAALTVTLSMSLGSGCQGRDAAERGGRGWDWLPLLPSSVAGEARVQTRACVRQGVCTQALNMAAAPWSSARLQLDAAGGGAALTVWASHNCSGDPMYLGTLADSALRARLGTIDDGLDGYDVDLRLTNRVRVISGFPADGGGAASAMVPFPTTAACVQSQVVVGGLLEPVLAAHATEWAVRFNALSGACGLRAWVETDLGRQLGAVVEPAACVACLRAASDASAVLGCFPAAHGGAPFGWSGLCTAAELRTVENVLGGSDVLAGDEKLRAVTAACQLCYALVRRGVHERWLSEGGVGTMNRTIRTGVAQRVGARCGGAFDAELGPGTHGAVLLLDYGRGVNVAAGRPAHAALPLARRPALNASFNANFSGWVTALSRAFALQVEWASHPAAVCSGYLGATLTLAQDLGALGADGSASRRAFELALQAELASLLSLPPGADGAERVELTALRAGSVLADVVVHPVPGTLAPYPSAAFTAALQHAARRGARLGGAPLRNVSGLQAPPPVRPIAATMHQPGTSVVGATAPLPPLAGGALNPYAPRATAAAAPPGSAPRDPACVACVGGNSEPLLPHNASKSCFSAPAHAPECRYYLVQPAPPPPPATPPEGRQPPAPPALEVRCAALPTAFGWGGPLASPGPVPLLRVADVAGCPQAAQLPEPEPVPPALPRGGADDDAGGVGAGGLVAALVLVAGGALAVAAGVRRKRRRERGQLAASAKAEGGFDDAAIRRLPDFASTPAPTTEGEQGGPKAAAAAATTKRAKSYRPLHKVPHGAPTGEWAHLYPPKLAYRPQRWARPPSAPEVAAFAQTQLGLAPQRVAAHRKLLYLAEACLAAPLPQGWAQGQDSVGRAIFFTFESGGERWTHDHPLLAHFQRLVRQKLRDPALYDGDDGTTEQSPLPSSPSAPPSTPALPARAGGDGAAGQP
jgi:hypothetical protein